jgi:NAD(P)-dependent dehydrogenase (short-subunit alcohol dehydrogenase family)
LTQPLRPRIIVIGATGTIGQAVSKELEGIGEVVRVGYTRGDLRLNARSRSDIEAFFSQAGPFDHLVSLVGTSLPIGPLRSLPPTEIVLGFEDKVKSQFELVQAGLNHIRDGGSFTLSGGFLNREPMPGFSVVAMINGAVECFVKCAALDMERGIRINAVSPVFVLESLAAAGIKDTSPYVTMSAADTAIAYRSAIEGDYNGSDLDPRQFIRA